MRWRTRSFGQRARPYSGRCSTARREGAGMRMKCKLEFPRFFVTIPDLARHLRQTGVPICRGPIQVLGTWPAQPPDAAGNGLLSVTARYGTTWDGFWLGYELTADVSPALYGQTRLADSDLQNQRLRYTDDRLE